MAAPASVGAVAGVGLYVALRVLGERLMAAPLVPVVWWFSLFAFAAAPGRRVAEWRTRPAPLIVALLALAAVLADLAHVFYVPFASDEGPVPFSPVHRHGAGLVVLLAALPVPFARLGRRLGEEVGRATEPARALATALAGLGAGFAVGLGAVLAIGGYEALLAWLVAVAALLAPRRAAVAVLVVCLASVTWVRAKPHGFLGAVPLAAWMERGWSADQKLDRLLDRPGECEAWAANSAVLGEPCTTPGAAPAGSYALLRELGASLAPREVLYLASSVPRRPAEIAAALPGTSHLTVVSAEPRTTAGASDARLTVVAGDPRHAVQVNAASAELVWIDGVDVPFVAGGFFPVPRSSWLFTEQGWRALFARLGERGAVVIERTQTTPEDFARLVRALPVGVKWAASACPRSLIPAALPCAWIGVSASDVTLASVREAFAAVTGQPPLEVPAVAATPRPATDDRPIVIFPEKLYAVESGGALAVIGWVAWFRRRRGGDVLGAIGRGPRTIAAGLALVQAAVAVSLGRATAQPGLATPLLVALGWLSLGGALAFFAGRVAVAGAPAVARPFAFAAASVAATLAAALTALAVASPFANRALAVPLVILAAAPAGALLARSWSTALADADAGSRAAAAGSVLSGYAVGLVLAPALVAADGFSLAALSGAVTILVTAWRPHLSRTGT